MTTLLTDGFPLLLLGLLGSGHCVGMCGPLVVAFPGQSPRIGPHLCYHGGRVSTYVIIGAVMGALGGGWGALSAGADLPSGLARVQVAGSLLVALMLLLMGLFRLGILREPGWLSVTPSTGAGERAALFRGARAGRPLALFFTGMLMGTLPCGLSYAAFIRCLAAGGWVQGAWLAMVFGAGTFPALLLVGTAAMGLLRRHRRLSDIVAGVCMLAMAADVGADALGALF